MSSSSTHSNKEDIMQLHGIEVTEAVIELLEPHEQVSRVTMSTTPESIRLIIEGFCDCLSASSFTRPGESYVLKTATFHQSPQPIKIVDFEVRLHEDGFACAAETNKALALPNITVALSLVVESSVGKEREFEFWLTLRQAPQLKMDHSKLWEADNVHDPTQRFEYSGDRAVPVSFFSDNIILKLLQAKKDGPGTVH